MGHILRRDRWASGLGRALLALLPLAPMAALAEERPVEFQSTEIGATSDPTGLFTPQEVEEGGSDVQPSIRYAVFPVDGGEVTLSVLVGEWCGMSECPFRFRLVADDGSDVAWLEDQTDRSARALERKPQPQG